MSITCSKLRTDGDEEYTPWVPPFTSSAGLLSLGVHSCIPSNASHLSDTMTIACEAMDAIYAPNIKLSSHEMEAIVTKADVELRSHYGALPTYLRLTASTQTPMLPHVFLYHVQYHAHLILLCRPLMQGRNKNVRRASDNTVDHEPATSSHGGEDNEHSAVCRHSATEITRLLRQYKQHYTLRRIPIAAVHLCFSAAVIHLIDARPSSPARQQAIRHLQTCVDSLEDLRVPWCMWSGRAIRAIQLLAAEWYHCEDLTQLQSCTESPNANTNGHSVLTIDDASRRGPGLGMPPELTDPESSASLVETPFTYDACTSDPFTDGLVREWLAEIGYEMRNVQCADTK